jgi:hypothetical protein
LWSRNFEFIDLKGDGIPGIVYKDEGNFLYAQPLGNGKYKKFTSINTCYYVSTSY